jgi:hypothetical protein
MPQSHLTQFFSATRDGSGTVSAISSHDLKVSSDDDAPMVINRRAPSASAGFTRRSDGRVLVIAKRSRYEGEAEESSGDEFVGSDSDSFVVSDHVSCASGRSSSHDVQQSLRDICESLRNRRQFLQCAQCVRLVRGILSFLSDIVDCMPNAP